jgi:hypothetical protein
MDTSKDHYQILGLDPTASGDEIRNAYKKLARAYHPDLNPKRKITAGSKFKRLQEAYSVLSDPPSREQYDQSLGISPLGAKSNHQLHQYADKHIQTGSWHIYFSPERGGGWLDRVNWRRKVAIVVWVLCVVGSFLPTSSSVIVSVVRFYQVSATERLVWISIPLVMMWLGSSLSDDDNLDTSAWSVLKVGSGIVLELLAWVSFARFIGLYLLGPLIRMVS